MKKNEAVTISEGENEKMQNFRNHMDSLAKTPSGKKMYDAILIDRPGLMDSVILIENIYQSQINK